MKDLHTVIQFSRNRVTQSVSVVPPPEVVAPPPGDAVPGKIDKIVATRGQILRLKCKKFYFGWGSDPQPAAGAYSAVRDPLAGFKEAYF